MFVVVVVAFFPQIVESIYNSINDLPGKWIDLPKAILVNIYM